MADTSVQEGTATELPPEAPVPQLPAIRQERRPRVPASPKPPSFPSSIAKAIIAVSRDIGEITKAGRNTFQNYNYAKWEDVNEKLSPLLAQHGLVIVQSEQSRSLLEENDKGSVLAIVYHFTIVNEAGEQWPPVEWTGIARLRNAQGVTDDKAATKCHTQAEKYFCVKQFKIRVAEENPADRSHALPKKDAREIYKKLQAEIDEMTSPVALGAWGSDPENLKRKATLPPDWRDFITTRYNEKLAELNGGPKVIWDDETGELIDDGPANAADGQAPAPTPPEGPAPGAGASVFTDERWGMAQAAAMRGKAVFDTFYHGCTRAEQAELRAHKAELEALYPKAPDAKLA